MIGVLAMGRNMAEGRMSDACTVSRKVGSVFNETTGEYVPSIQVIYAGFCRVKASTSGKDVDAGSQLLATSSTELHVPVGTAEFAPDDSVVITGSVTRAGQVGRKFTIVGPFDGSQTTALRYRVEAFDGR